ncbi:hypothetical protein NLG97_g11381 [Lecanicillium saksenae]|uniref:Uncharacterized protein n=1 Tax=Lecanicillium saksenae TaxID=468837 RepID=A0ACC1QD85_9HYPO|nr:hypothetical protein NLG97_g11381 [Lecanicillium saksenae]
MMDGLVDSRRETNAMLDLLQGRGGRSAFGLLDPETPGQTGGAGAAAAAGVLTAVDEDGEGDEEANVPDEFDYFTDSSDIE